VVKLVVPVRLFPTAAQEAALRATLDLRNDAANTVSAQAYQRRVFGKQSLRRLVYGDLKDMGLSAQPAIHVARKVAGTYATLNANIRAGNLGKPGLTPGPCRSGPWPVGWLVSASPALTSNTWPCPRTVAASPT
jgi:hypothetical protein